MSQGPGLSRKRWNSLKLANRLPELEFDRKMDKIRRDHAESKRDKRLEESKLWDYLFENRRALKASFVRKTTLKDIMSGQITTKTLKTRDSKQKQEIPQSELYRQFVIFKAVTTHNIFGDKAQTRPKYGDLYDSERRPHENNQKSIDDLFERYGQEGGYPGPDNILAAITLWGDREQDFNEDLDYINAGSDETSTILGQRRKSLRPMRKQSLNLDPEPQRSHSVTDNGADMVDFAEELQGNRPLSTREIRRKSVEQNFSGRQKRCSQPQRLPTITSQSPDILITDVKGIRRRHDLHGSKRGSQESGNQNDGLSLPPITAEKK